MLEEKQRTKLTKQILLFSSSFEGEQISALNAANKTLKKNNSSWHEVVAALDSNGEHYDGAGFADGFQAGFQAGCNHKNQPDHHEMLCQIKRKEHLLNDWSKSFIDNLHTHKDWHLTEKQCACIERLYHQFCGN